VVVHRQNIHHASHWRFSLFVRLSGAATSHNSDLKRGVIVLAQKRQQIHPTTCPRDRRYIPIRSRRPGERHFRTAAPTANGLANFRSLGVLRLIAASSKAGSK